MYSYNYNEFKTFGRWADYCSGMANKWLYQQGIFNWEKQVSSLQLENVKKDPILLGLFGEWVNVNEEFFDTLEEALENFSIAVLWNCFDSSCGISNKWDARYASYLLKESTKRAEEFYEICSHVA